MKKFGSYLFFTLLTMGCAQQITPASQEQNNAKIFNAAIIQSAQRATQCLDEISKNSSVQYVYANILFENPTSQNKKNRKKAHLHCVQYAIRFTV